MSAGGQASTSSGGQGAGKALAGDIGEREGRLRSKMGTVRGKEGRLQEEERTRRGGGGGGHSA